MTRLGIDLYNIGKSPEELQSALILLRQEFDAHNHDGASSRDFQTLIAETVSARVVTIRKSSFNDATAGIWMGLDDNIMKLSLGDGSSFLTWNGTTLAISGTLTATAGTIGGWTINDTTLTGGGVTLDSAGVITGGIIQTDAAGTSRLRMSNSDAAFQFMSSSDIALVELKSTSVPYSGLAGAAFQHSTGTIMMEISGQGEGLGSRQVVWTNSGGSKYFGFIDNDSSDYYLFGNARMAGDWDPQSDDTYDLGDSTHRWKDVHVRGYLYLYEPAGSSYIRIIAPSLSSNYTFTLPTNDGTSGQYLQTNGSGTLTWATVSTTGFADTDLNNLTTTSINEHLIPAGATQDLGTSALPWDRLYVDDIYLTNNDGGIYYNSNLALDFYATRIELGSTYDDLSPATGLSANFGDTNRWNQGNFDTLDLAGAIDMNNNDLQNVSGLRLQTGTAHNPAVEGEITFYDSGSIQYRGQIISTDYSFDLTVA